MLPTLKLSSQLTELHKKSEQNRNQLNKLVKMNKAVKDRK